MKIITRTIKYAYTEAEVDILLAGAWKESRERAMTILGCECEYAIAQAEKYRAKAKECFDDAGDARSIDEALARAKVVQAYNDLADYYIKYADICMAASEKL